MAGEQLDLEHDGEWEQLFGKGPGGPDHGSPLGSLWDLGCAGKVLQEGGGW